MKAAVLFLLSAAVAGACAPATPRAVEIRIHYSHYSTTQIDVPAGVPVTFTIYNDGTYTDDYTLRILDRTGSTQQSFRDTGTYQQNNTALQFRDSATGDVFSGSITSNVLTVTYLGDIYVYQR